MELYQGKSVCANVAIGKVFLYRRESIPVTKRQVFNTKAEVARFQAAKAAAAAQLDGIWRKALDRVGADDAAVFIFHKMLLEDAEYQDTVQTIIREEKQNAEYAVTIARDRLAKRFEVMEDPYMRARAADIVDISERLLAVLDAAPSHDDPGTARRRSSVNISDERKPRFSASDNAGRRTNTSGAPVCRIGADGQPIFSEPVILVTDELAPSEAVLLDKSRILAFVTRRGSANSHASILTRSMGIPAVTGIDFRDDWAGRMAFVDGDNGIVIIDPEPAFLEQVEGNRQA